MRKIIILLLCCVVLVGMVGCGGNTAPPPTESPPTTVSETIITEPPTETTPPIAAVEPTEKEKEPPPTESKDQATKPTTTAANKIEQGFGRNEGSLSEDKQILNQTVKTPQTAKFEPKQPKIRRPGTGCITEINDHLFEGRYSPTNAYGKRTPKNVYAKTREECEEKLASVTKQKGVDLLTKISRWKCFLCMARFCLDNKVGGYRCRSQVPEHEILKIVRMYEPIITEFFDNEEEMAKFQKWREEYEEKERLEKEEKAKKKVGVA